MSQQAELYRKIDKLPQKYFGEVIDFVGYLENKARKEAEQTQPSLREQQKARDIEIINQYAEELNREAMDVLSYQWPGFSEAQLREMEFVNRQAAELNKEFDS
ncbi:hypothetical protein R84B8_01965 [Treponema sp. R8-4-B8]